MRPNMPGFTKNPIYIFRAGRPLPAGWKGPGAPLPLRWIYYTGRERIPQGKSALDRRPFPPYNKGNRRFWRRLCKNKIPIG